MKKRILSILLTLCMMLCLTPISVFAEEVGAWGSAAIKLGADALNKTVNTEIAPTVYFGQTMKIIPLHGELSVMTETVLQAHKGILPCLRHIIWVCQSLARVPLMQTAI